MDTYLCWVSGMGGAYVDTQFVSFKMGVVSYLNEVREWQVR